MAASEEISSGTRARYTREAERIRRRFVRQVDQEPEVDCTAFRRWMAAEDAGLAPSSRRQYHAALAYYQALHHPDCMPGPIPEGLPIRKAIQKEHGRRTSSAKSKNLPESVERSVLNTLWNATEKPRGSIYSIWAESIFRAGLRFGLRPSEWQGSRFIYLDDGELALEVPNGKSSQGRTFGPSRTLIVDEARIDRIDPRAIDAAVWLTEKTRLLSKAEYEDMLQRARKQMRLILKRCGKPCRASSGEVTLYTARHQFTATAKSDGLTREVIAALMGHASIYTAGEHYGRKRHGRGGNAPSAGQEGGSKKERMTVVSPHPEDLYAVVMLEQERQEQRRTQPKRGPGMG